MLARRFGMHRAGRLGPAQGRVRWARVRFSAVTAGSGSIRPTQTPVGHLQGLVRVPT